MSSKDAGNLGMPLEMARQSLRDDPNTAKIAETMGLEVELYIDKVLEYALNPQKKPQLEIMDDADAREMGVEVHSYDDVCNWLDGVSDGSIPVDSGRREMSLSDGFSTQATEAERLKAEARGRPRRGPAPSPAPKISAEAGAVLKQQLADRQRQNQLSMDARRAGRTKPKS